MVTILQVMLGVGFLYVFWRNLRQNYHDYRLVEFSWLVLLGFLVGSRAVFALTNGASWRSNWQNWIMLSSYPGLSTVGGYLGVLSTTLLMSKINRWKLWQLLEDMTVITLIFLILFKVAQGSGNWAGILVMVLTLLITLVVKNKYRSFVWYKSGKKGFLWFWANMMGWLLLAGETYLTKGELWVMIASVILALISGGGLFMLGRSSGS